MNRKGIGLALAVAIWLVWAVVPGALLTTTAEHTQAFAAAQIGAASLPYLQGAPAALTRYLIVSQGVALPALLALAWSLPSRPEAHQLPAQAVRRYFIATLLPLLGYWLALYFAGNAFMAVLDLYRGANASVVRGYGFRLGLYGFTVTLPQWGWVLLCRTLFRRSWLSTLLGIFGGAAVATASVVLRARHYAVPTPAFLRNELFSGRADLVAHAQLGFLLWGIALATLALLRLVPLVVSRHSAAHADEGA